jgi:hypothetical protein
MKKMTTDMILDLRDDDGKPQLGNLPSELKMHLVNEYLKTMPLELLWLAATSKGATSVSKIPDILAQVQESLEWKLFWTLVENIRVTGEECYVDTETGKEITRQMYLERLEGELKRRMS